MPDTVKVILDLSYEVQALLAEQEIDLYRGIQRQLPTVQITKEQDSERGGRFPHETP